MGDFPVLGEISSSSKSATPNKPMFFPLRELTFFKSFSIEPGGYGLVWNDEIDISEYELWKNGVVIGD